MNRYCRRTYQCGDLSQNKPVVSGDVNSKLPRFLDGCKAPGHSNFGIAAHTLRIDNILVDLWWRRKD